MPNEDFGEEVKAVVQPAEGAEPGPELERELIAYCREHLADVKCPRSVDFVDELPRHPTGKLYKRLLARPVLGRPRHLDHLEQCPDPRPPGSPSWTTPAPIPFAHRGGAGDWPENTMPAFEAAVALGYRYLETDVHVTTDGVLCAFHDDRLDRVTDRTGEIAELPWSEVRQAQVDGREPIPLLEDLLGTWPDVRINIDPKHDSAVDALAAVLTRTSSVERVCIGAFSDRRLARLRALARPTPVHLPRAQGDRVDSGLTSLTPIRSAMPGACVQVPPELPRRAHRRRPLPAGRPSRRNLPVHVWTIDDDDEMRRLLDLGVDGIMTDRPTVLKDVLVERGQWV